MIKKSASSGHNVKTSTNMFRTVKILRFLIFTLNSFKKASFSSGNIKRFPLFYLYNPDSSHSYKLTLEVIKYFYFKQITTSYISFYSKNDTEYDTFIQKPVIKIVFLRNTTHILSQKGE